GSPEKYYAYATNRAGSYAINWYLVNASWFLHAPSLPFGAARAGDFLSEAQVQAATLTPVLADSTNWKVSPNEGESPAWAWRDNTPPINGEMGQVAIPRHGNRPNPVPARWPWDQPLPGAVNVAFFDGHGETVKLERLWKLYWHEDYMPLAKRP